MITKAIIEQIYSDGYHYRVRIPILHKIENAPGATPFNELPIALVCFAPGCKPNLDVGDVVYVGFENNQYSEPVILGMLLNDSYKESSASIIADSINASVNATFPQSNVNFGNVSISDMIDASSSSSFSGGGEGLTKAEYELLLAKIHQLLLQFPD